ncbi:MAG TPA: hypothetical protein GX001_02185 [Acholeplasmataceae bacterium]|nr:hypothetical protein [Acholeplasmataceae bacterium]
MRNLIIKIVISALLIISLIVGITILLARQKPKFPTREPYDKSHYVYVEDYLEDTIVMDNNNFRFILNTDTTTFELLNKKTNTIWYSNAYNPLLDVPYDTKELFVLYYERQLEASKAISINDESVSYQRYAFYQKDNILEILYEVGGKHNVSMSDLPKIIGKNDYENKVLEPLEEKALTDSNIRRQLSFLKRQFVFVEAQNYYQLRTQVSQDSIDIVYDLLFRESLYTFDDFIADAEKYGFESAKKIPYFEFVIAYELNEDGFSIKLKNESIFEEEDFPIAYIDILPYFGAGKMGDNGYTVIPDGSGVLIDHNNNKYDTLNYEKRIYGSDLAIGSAESIKPETQEIINLPMYGYNLNGESYLNIIEEGEFMTSVRAGFKTEKSGGELKQKIPFIHYRYYLRERDAFEFTSLTTTHPVTTYTREYNKEDFKAKYLFLEKPSYYDMAHAYQQYIVTKYQLEKITIEPNLHLTLLGGYQETKYVLGYAKEVVKPLTKSEDIIKIVNEYQEKGLDNLAISYQGFSNGGLNSTIMNRISYDKSIARERDLKRTINKLNEQNINIYLEFITQQAYTNKRIKKSEYLLNIFQEKVKRYPYNEATSLSDKNEVERYILNKEATNKIIDFASKYNKKLNNNTLALTDFGQRLATDFTINKVTFRNDYANSIIDKLKEYDDQEILLRNPNLYALLWGDVILDLPTVGTLHKIVDYSIPFLQLVFNGYKTYAGASINTSSNRSLNWHFLKAMETGSLIQYTLSYLPTYDLAETIYSKYNSVYYKNWLDNSVDFQKRLEELQIYQAIIVNHETLNKQGSIVKVTYSNGIAITINYELETYTLGG